MLPVTPQTAMSLIHDPKGWDIIGDVLANPELIENFVGQQKAANLPAKAAKEDLSEFGVDFSPSVDGAVGEESVDVKPAAGEDGAADYYSSVRPKTQATFALAGHGNQRPRLRGHRRRQTQETRARRPQRAAPDLGIHRRGARRLRVRGGAVGGQQLHARTSAGRPAEKLSSERRLLCYVLR